EVAGVLHVHFDPGGEAFGRKPVDRAEPAAVDVDVAGVVGGAVVELARPAIGRLVAGDDGTGLQVDLHQRIVVAHVQPAIGQGQALRVVQAFDPLEVEDPAFAVEAADEGVARGRVIAAAGQVRHV